MKRNALIAAIAATLVSAAALAGPGGFGMGMGGGMGYGAGGGGRRRGLPYARCRLHCDRNDRCDRLRGCDGGTRLSACRPGSALAAFTRRVPDRAGSRRARVSGATDEPCAAHEPGDAGPDRSVASSRPAGWGRASRRLPPGRGRFPPSVGSRVWHRRGGGRGAHHPVRDPGSQGRPLRAGPGSRGRNGARMGRAPSREAKDGTGRRDHRRHRSGPKVQT